MCFEHLRSSVHFETINSVGLLDAASSVCIQLQISVVRAPSALRVWVLTSSSVSAGSLSRAGSRKVMVWSSATQGEQPSLPVDGPGVG